MVEEQVQLWPGVIDWRWIDVSTGMGQLIAQVGRSRAFLRQTARYAAKRLCCRVSEVMITRAARCGPRLEEVGKGVIGVERLGCGLQGVRGPL